MPTYQDAYRSLNAAQKQAVDQTDGPVLVIAGPGTGKTQLLATRIAHILSTTDTAPENILCLTFTEAAAANMRDRLTNMIGQAAYGVTISTYHGFGNDILKKYPEFFSDALDLQPADELRIDQLLREVQAALPYSNPLKHEIFIKDVRMLIGDFRQALLTPDDVRHIAAANQAFIDQASQLVREHIGAMPKMTKASIPLFAQLLEASAALKPTEDLPVLSLAQLWHDTLTPAVEAALETDKTNPLTPWKNDWLARDGESLFTVEGRAVVRKLQAAADIYERYLEALEQHGLRDYSDMILQAITGLEANDDLRFTIQERYQYLLLDEFQDTNGAQLKLVQLLTDNPVNEGRPNVLAVGDDDQAIFAFQGAHYSHMLDFYHHYRDVLIVPLTENYRSTSDILRLGEGISTQIAERLHYHFNAIDKTLTAASKPRPTTIQRHEFVSDLSQNAWVAQQIIDLIEGGIPANEIAVLAPKHQFLETLVPFLHEQHIPVHYEKREDILEDPAVRELILMSRLVIALADQDQAAANGYWPQVLSLPYWQLPTSVIWQISFEAGRDEPWVSLLAEHVQTAPIALFFIRLSLLVRTEPLETMLDYLVGTLALDLHEDNLPKFESPFYRHYFGSKGQVLSGDDPVEFWQLLSNLTVLRQRLRDYHGDTEMLPTLPDFLAFVAAHQAADIKILNTNPYQESDKAVELMTAFKSKGQEFTAVFLLALNDEVWGSRAKNQSSRIAIPKNLQHIRYAGATQDERLRLLYVAITRAKTQLFMANYRTNFSGTAQSRLKYLNESDDGNHIVSPLLPADSQQVIVHDNATPPSLQDLGIYWHQQHRDGVSSPALRELLRQRLKHFQLTASKLNRFIDVADDGPTSLLLRDLLRFPHGGSNINGLYGDAIHETLRFIHTHLKADKRLPSIAVVMKKFEHTMRHKLVTPETMQQLLERGRICLSAYLKQRAPQLQTSDFSEYDFHQEGVFVGDVHLSGTVDRMIVNEETKTITVVDFKTGRRHAKWDKEIRLHKYRQQLYFYKLLVENSQTFKDYVVTDAYLEYVEPDADDGQIHELHLKFTEDDYDDFCLLLRAVWQHIITLEFPTVSGYSDDLKGTEQFEADLRAGVI